MRAPVPFGKYLLLDRISVGGMAEVFKAKSYGVEGFEKIIAIKRILPSMGDDQEFIKMFVDEAKIAGQLAHANICQIFELGRIDGAHFIAMEFIWGKDLLQLQNRLRKLNQPMSTTIAAYIISKACDGLDHAHRKRDPMGAPLEVVHRDCSPQNLLVSYEGEVKVIDFGIAKAATRSANTVAGVLKGKFSYMSPEQVRGQPMDRRSDIFALGTVLYECITGEKLFQAETDFATLEKVRNGTVEPPRTIKPDIPEELERIVMKALAREPEQRYQWCSEFAADLQRFLMRQATVFTAKNLATWVRTAFAVEMDRERVQLDDYKRLGRDGQLLPGAAPARVDAQVFASSGAPSDPASDLDENDGRDEHTSIASSPFFDEGGATIVGQLTDFVDHAQAQALVSSPRVIVAPDAHSHAFHEDQPTAIFGPGNTPPPVIRAKPPRAPTRPGVPTRGPTSAGGGSSGVRPPRPPTMPPPLPPVDLDMPTVSLSGPAAWKSPTQAMSSEQGYQSHPGPSQPYPSQPDQSQPYQSQPYPSQPDQSQPYQSQPYQSQPYQSQPHQSQPHQSQPYQSQPYQSQPYQSQPYQQPTYAPVPMDPLHSRQAAPPMTGLQSGRQDPTTTVAPLDATMRARRKSTLRRDLLIGGGIAVGVLVIAAVLRFAVFGGGSAVPAGNGTGIAGTKTDAAVAVAVPAIVHDARPASDAVAAGTSVIDAAVLDVAPDAAVVVVVDAAPDAARARPDANELRPDSRRRVDARPSSGDHDPPPETASKPGFLQVFSKPSAQVVVDGKELGKSTPIVGPKRLSLSPGRHRIGLKYNGEVRIFTVTIVSGQTATLSKSLE